MLVTQRLHSGLIVRQDFRRAVRFVMYETGYPGFDYATHGGTMLIANFQGKPFGITCAHVRGDFEWRQLVVTDSKFGREIAGLAAVYRASDPSGDAVDSDVLDLVVIEFSNDVGPSFFGDTAYVLDGGTIGSSSSGDQLRVNGAFKAESTILDEAIAPQFGLLEFLDAGPHSTDPVLRRAIARYRDRQFEGLTGLSGAPIFNAAQSKLAGIVARGSMTGDDAILHYIDIAHVHVLLASITSGSLAAQYRVVVPK